MKHKKPYDDFDDIPELKDLTPWDSIHLDPEEFVPYLKTFLPDRITLEPYGDRFALWFGKEFALIISVETSKRVNRNELTGELCNKLYLVSDGALINNGVRTKEVLNANLKFKRARRAVFNLRRIIYDILTQTTIREIAGIPILTLYLGSYGTGGAPLPEEEALNFINKQKDNRDVPEPLIKVPNRVTPSHKSMVATKRF